MVQTNEVAANPARGCVASRDADPGVFVWPRVGAVCLVRGARRRVAPAQPGADRLGLGQSSQPRKQAGARPAGHHLPLSAPSSIDLSAELGRGREG